jgi:hypothetical protein
MPEYLSHAEIAEELDFLFDVLKHSYAAYQYFGGDEVFGAVKQLMLTKLSRMSDPVSINDYLTELLVPCLGAVIADNHFQVEGQQIGVSNQLYMNDEFVVFKTEDGYITEMDGRAYRVIPNETWSWNKGLLPTLTRDGELAFAFGRIFIGEARYLIAGINVTLEDVETGEQSTRGIGCVPVSDEYHQSMSRDTYALSEADGITVLQNRRLWEQNESVLSEFVETGVAVRDEPVLILDLRGHEGGNDSYAHQWVQRYTGKSVSAYPFLGATLLSATANALNPGYRTASPPRWQSWSYSDPQFISNDNLVIVLMDNAMSSSGESLIGALRSLDNAVFVGTNTAGCLVTGNVGIATLPISKQNIRFGINLNIRPDLSQFEGIGFMPDLWVPPGESLERVLRFVERYKTTE